MRNFLRILSLGLIIGLLLSSCSKPKSEESTSTDVAVVKEMKDTLTIAHWQEPATLDPQSSNMIAWFIVERQIFNTLIMENADGTYSPELALSWELIDDKTMRFNLREDVVFHNGEKFTAEDVLFSITRGTLSPKSASTYKTVDADKSKVVDDYTFDLALKYPDQAILNTLATIRGCIVSKKAVEELGEADFARTPVGTGAYKIAEWIPGTEISLIKNEDYFGDKALTENLKFKFIPEASNRVIELETGGVDLAYNVASTDVNRVKELDGYNIFMAPSYRYTTITMSMKDKLLSNLKLREALTYAIDKEAVVEVVYGDTAAVLNGVIPTNALGYKEMTPTPYDVELAKKLVAEAGYPDGLELTFLVEPGSEYENIAEAVQNMWKKIGVTAELVTMSRQAYLAQGSEYQVAIRAGNANHPSNILIIYDSAFGDRIQPNDDYIDNGLLEFRQIYDDAERKIVLDALQQHIWDIHYTIPIAHTSVIFGVSDKVENFKTHPLGLVELSKLAVYK